MNVVALIDFDNVRVAPIERPGDLDANLSEFFKLLPERVGQVLTDVREIQARFYGGWIDESGRYTQLASEMLTALSSFRGLRDGMRVLPLLATSLERRMDYHLLGTIRMQARPFRQKMVDTMMVADSLFLSRYDNRNIVLVSNDDDLVPAALEAVEELTGPARICWLRLRDNGQGLNDGRLTSVGVALGRLR